MGYVYLAESYISPGLLKIGRVKNDPQKHIAQLETDDSRNLRLIHAFAVSNPREIERQLHGQFAAAHTQGEWYQVSVAEAKRAMYTIEQHVASNDAQSELDRFILEAGGAEFGLGANILMLLSLFTSLGSGVVVAALLCYIWWLIIDDSHGVLVLFFLGMMIGFPAGLSLAEMIGNKIKRTMFASEIAEKSQRIKQEYEETFSVKVFIS